MVGTMLSTQVLMYLLTYSAYSGMLMEKSSSVAEALGLGLLICRLGTGTVSCGLRVQSGGGGQLCMHHGCCCKHDPVYSDLMWEGLHDGSISGAQSVVCSG